MVLIKAGGTASPGLPVRTELSAVYGGHFPQMGRKRVVLK